MTSPLTPADLAAIEARCAKATEGPLGVYRITYEHQPGHLVIGSPDPRDLKHDIYPTVHDAAFLAHAFDDVPDLLAEVRRLEADNERMRRGIEVVASCKVVSVDPPDCPQIARNLLAGREWSNSADGAEGESK